MIDIATAAAVATIGIVTEVVSPILMPQAHSLPDNIVTTSTAAVHNATTAAASIPALIVAIPRTTPTLLEDIIQASGGMLARDGLAAEASTYCHARRAAIQSCSLHRIDQSRRPGQVRPTVRARLCVTICCSMRFSRSCRASCRAGCYAIQHALLNQKIQKQAH
jgi:hypothetical protein